MYHLPERNKRILAKKIRYYKDIQFPGKGSGKRLADEVGVAPQTLSNWLSGSRLPTVMQLYCLSKVFDVSPLELCGIRSKHKSPHSESHISMVFSILQQCENTILNSANSHIKDKMLKDVISILQKELSI